MGAVYSGVWNNPITFTGVKSGNLIVVAPDIRGGSVTTISASGATLVSGSSAIRGENNHEISVWKATASTVVISCNGSSYCLSAQEIVIG